MRVTFWGAAGEVTGSLHEVQVNGDRFLLDCGLAQGRRKDAEQKNRCLPLAAKSVTGVVLSHAHIDHSGNLPTLVKNGLDVPDLRRARHRGSLPCHVAGHRSHPAEGRGVRQ
jgi:metallo-beta-lactamase family protein